MKKIAWLGTLLACLLAVGCAATPDPEAEEAPAPQSQMEEQIEPERTPTSPAAPPAAESESAQASAAEEASPEATPEAEPSTRAPAAQSPAAHTLESYDMAGLKDSVDSVVEKISTATLSSDVQKDRTAFRELHSELEAVEAQLDRMEDLIEADVRAGTLSRSDYQELDRQLDALEDQLDRAEDTLEFTFGVDD